MNNLRHLRIQRGMTQKALAAALSVAQNTVSQWESGTRSLDSESLARLVSFFEVSADHILGLPKYPVQFDDFEYALHQEIKQLTDEDKEDLLRMARRMRELTEYKAEGK